MRKLGLLILAVITACTTSVPGGDPTQTTDPDQPDTSSTLGEGNAADSSTSTSAAAAPTTYPPAPEVSGGPLDPTTEQALDALIDSVLAGDFQASHLGTVVEGGDVRGAWIIGDLLRFFQGGTEGNALVTAFSDLTGIEENRTREVDFVWAFNHLIAWDVPAWEDYPEMKGRIYRRIEPRWEVFFDQDHGVDWRLVTWGGVLADDRPLGDNGPCNCIPALDNPATTGAAGGDWYEDERIVFGVVVNGEALALPKHQMEVHEMVNATLGGRDLGIPYCTLCGSAQAYFTDDVAGIDRVVLRTSGLLSRSNKLMYDLTTRSAIDTFTGEALTGPLGEAGVVLEQVTVVASTWGDWKEAHPGTRILAEDGGIGRQYSDDPLGGRDDEGPIFPVGDIDQRLPVQESVVGVITPDGTPIAFPVNATMDAYEPGEEFDYEGTTVRISDGIRVFDDSGEELPTHQAFWFAWSQFHPQTLVWPEPS